MPSSPRRASATTPAATPSRRATPGASGEHLERLRPDERERGHGRHLLFGGVVDELQRRPPVHLLPDKVGRQQRPRDRQAEPGSRRPPAPLAAASPEPDGQGRAERQRRCLASSPTPQATPKRSQWRRRLRARRPGAVDRARREQRGDGPRPRAARSSSTGCGTSQVLRRDHDADGGESSAKAPPRSTRESSAPSITVAAAHRAGSTRSARTQSPSTTLVTRAIRATSGGWSDVAQREVLAARHVVRSSPEDP